MYHSEIITQFIPLIYNTADIFSVSLLTIFEVSIVQYNVSVRVVGVVFDDASVRMLLG